MQRQKTKTPSKNKTGGIHNLRARASYWRSQGLCLDCGNDREPERLRCKPCLKKNAAQQKRKRMERKNSGHCYMCDEIPEEGFVCCNRHRDIYKKQAREWRKRRPKDICMYCRFREPVKNEQGKYLTTCEECSFKRKLRQTYHGKDRPRKKGRIITIENRFWNVLFIKHFQSCTDD